MKQSFPQNPEAEPFDPFGGVTCVELALRVRPVRATRPMPAAMETAISRTPAMPRPAWERTRSPHRYRVKPAYTI